MVRKSIIFM